MNDQSVLDNFNWQPQPKAANWISGFVAICTTQSEFVKRLQNDMASKTGTRLTDWIDHLVVPESNQSDLFDVGYESDGGDLLVHHEGIFPKIRFGEQRSIAIKVESVDAFVQAQGLSQTAIVVGEPNSQLRTATLETGRWRFVAVERHGYPGFQIQAPNSSAVDVRDLLANRCRAGTEDSSGHDVAEKLIKEAIDRIGRDWACDLFFATERDYWMARNRAAQTQKARQDRLGLGWANHDHHTYRCSRENFALLIRVFEMMGFECRERFYAGEEAGWGAQVLEHANCGIVIFADVDLGPNEIVGDFAHDGLKAKTDFGTVGLWCKLHGDSFLEAGMHHLECQFDFDKAREQLAEEQIETMAPFTDFPFLRQAFTKGENWQIDDSRLNRLLKNGSISKLQYEQFLTQGAIGSHLEILERNDGYKGFNQTGVSDIILKTDPRRRAVDG